MGNQAVSALQVVRMSCPRLLYNMLHFQCAAYWHVEVRVVPYPSHRSRRMIFRYSLMSSDYQQ